MGEDEGGKFFHYYENATSGAVESDNNQGTSPNRTLNKLYINPVTGIMRGTPSKSLLSAERNLTVTGIRGARVKDKKRFESNQQNRQNNE